MPRTLAGYTDEGQPQYEWTDDSSGWVKIGDAGEQSLQNIPEELRQYARVNPDGTVEIPQWAQTQFEQQGAAGNPAYAPYYHAPDSGSFIGNALSAGGGLGAVGLTGLGFAAPALMGAAGAGAGAVGAGEAANLAGLTQMGGAAGLSGPALESFIASGGTLGSTAAGGGGIGLGATTAGLGAGLGASGGLTEAQALELAGTEMTPAELASAPGGVPETVFSGPPNPSLAGIPGIGGAAGGAAAGSALSRIIDGTGTTADWTQVLGTTGATALGMFSANQLSNTLTDLASQNRAERAPFLSAGTNYLDPNAWISGPGKAFTDQTLQQLSAGHGNPIGSPTAMGIATDAGMRNWLSGVNTLGGLGLSGQNVQANLGAGAASAQSDVWGNLAGGVSDLINPKKSLADYLKLIV